MSWNYRILAFKQKGEIYFQMYEFYYDKNNKPNGYTDKPIRVSGDSLKSIKWVLKKMKKATKKPILWSGKKFPKKYKK